MTHLK